MNNGDKALCRANLFVGEEEPALFQIEYFRAFTPSHLSTWVYHYKANTHKLCALIMPPSVAGTIFNSHVYGVWMEIWAQNGVFHA